MIITKDKCSTIMITFLKIINQIKLYHWQTLKYSRHKATDELYNSFSELTDQFIETLTGHLIIDSSDKCPVNITRIPVPDNCCISLGNYTDDDGCKLLKEIKTFLKSNELNTGIGMNTELGNIRDEMLASVNKAVYLFSLN